VDERVGAIVGGKYRLERVIGQGSSATVFDAIHVVTQRHFAIKMISAQLVERSRTIGARFLREARAFSSLNHEAIVEMIDAGKEPDGSLYLVQELLDGETLADAIERGDLSLRETAKIGIEILDALQVMHERKILHRDIKPENIFLIRQSDGTMRAKILDLGLARSMEELIEVTKNGALVGTPMYMSPEQARGDKNVDPRSDVWAIGATLFHTIADRPPFMSVDLMALFTQLITTRAPSLGTMKSGLPASLVQVIDRALEPEASNRWQSAREMGDALAAVLKDLPHARPRRVHSSREITVPQAIMPSLLTTTEIEGKIVHDRSTIPVPPLTEPVLHPAQDPRRPIFGWLALGGAIALSCAVLLVIRSETNVSTPATIAAPSDPPAPKTTEPMPIEPPTIAELAVPTEVPEPPAPKVTAVEKPHPRPQPKKAQPRPKEDEPKPRAREEEPKPRPIQPVRAAPAIVAPAPVRPPPPPAKRWDDPLRSYE
jgi:eukaryotic-like serine/threonine-protein kinase